MKSNVGSTLIAAGAFAAVGMLATPSHAQNAAPVQIVPVPVQVSPGPMQVTPMPYPNTAYQRYPIGAEKTEFVVPNPVLLGAGGIAFLGAYIPSVVVAASSDHDGDKWLYVPVAGPWVDWAVRGCGSGDNPATCGVNGFDRVGLIASGAVQGLGVLAMIGSFTMPSKRLMTTTGEVHFAPASFGRGSSGLMAFGSF
jgi:hypothetical protein